MTTTSSAPCGVTVEAAAQPQEDEPSATRSFDKTTVEPGGRVVVTITAKDYGEIGAVVETLPTGFTFRSSNLSDVEMSDGSPTFALLGLGDKRFTYTVTASSNTGQSRLLR